MATMLEQLRALHEEIEALELAAVGTLESKGKSTREALVADLKVSAYLNQAQATSTRLLSLYTDVDGTLRDSVAAISGGSADGALASFYTRLADVHDAHRGRSSAPVESTITGGLDEAAVDAVTNLFSSEELYGRYVDMMSSFEEWANLPGVRDARTAGASAESGLPEDAAARFAKVDYIAYLRDLPALHATASLPTGRVKGSRQYRKYVASLAAYLAGFVSRAHPLVDLSVDVIDAFARDFAAAVLGSGAAGAGGPSSSSGSTGSSSSGSTGSSSSGSASPGATPDAVEWARSAVAGASAASGSDGVAASTNGSSSSVGSDAPLVGVASFATPEALAEALGADGVRAQLKARGLKVGGTPEERASRLWSVRDLSAGQYPKKLLAAPAPSDAAGKQAGDAQSGKAAPPPALTVAESAPLHAKAVTMVDPAAVASAALAAHGIRLAGAAQPPSDSESPSVTLPSSAHAVVVTAFLEDVCLRLAGALGDVLTGSARRAERRLTRTYAELEAERAAEEEEATRVAPKAGAEGGAAAAGGGMGGDDDSDDEDGPIYNPLNLPLGWDGKPIPYWLWKLQGLNIPYSCEICGGATYYGRRNFDRHFQEWRHAGGMRALGIPNTKHFHDVTAIADAQALYAKLRGSAAGTAGGAGGSAPAGAEEYEDSAGNVLDRRTYEDLARAGLL